MNSTEIDDLESAIERFFDQQLMPVAQQYRKDGNEFFAMTPDPECRSYYTLRSLRTMSREDFETVNIQTTQTLADALCDLWNRQGHPEIDHLAPLISEIAHALRMENTEDEGISEMMYVMF